MKILLLLIMLMGCSSPTKHLHEYSDGYYEDLYLCDIYPYGFSMYHASSSEVTPKNATEIQAKEAGLKNFNVQCKKIPPNCL